MKMRLTVVYEWETGANDVETHNAYGTLDPDECVAVDVDNIKMLGLTDFLSFVEDDLKDYKIEVVPE